MQRDLLGHFVPFACKNGEAILLQGEVPEWACLLTEGEAVVRTLDPDGFSAILYRYRPGEIFGDLEIVCRQRVITTVFAAGIAGAAASAGRRFWPFCSGTRGSPCASTKRPPASS